jgi:hypothetical protein
MSEQDQERFGNRPDVEAHSNRPRSGSNDLEEDAARPRNGGNEVEAHSNRPRTDEPRDEMDRVRETDEPTDEVEGHVLTPRAKQRNSGL